MRPVGGSSYGNYRGLEMRHCAQKSEFEQLLAEARFYGDALASLGAAAGNHRASALGLHARTKPVRLGTATTVGLECALRHSKLRSSLAKS